MKKLGLLLIGLFLINCGTVKEIAKKTSSDITIKFDNQVKGRKFTIEPDDDKKFWKVTNLETGDEFKLSFTRMKSRNAAYRNWMVVQKRKPTITKIESGEFDYIIYFSYIDPKDNKSILGGKVSINKKYIKSPTDSTSKYLWGALGGVSLWAIVVTIVLVV